MWFLVSNLIVKTPKVGTYNLDYYDIYSKVKKYNDEPKELRDLKPGFNVGAKRFEAIKEEPTVIKIGFKFV